MLSAIIVLIILGAFITMLCLPWKPLTLRETAIESAKIIGMIILFWLVTYLFGRADILPMQVLQPLIKIMHMASVAMTCLGLLKIGLMLVTIGIKPKKANDQ